MENFLKKTPIKKDGILSFEIKDEKTKKVTEFYDEKPFPNYKNDDNKNTILNKGDKNFLANQFKKFIGYKKNVLEVGCGTGQLSNYFAIGTNNNIVGNGNSNNTTNTFGIRWVLTDIHRQTKPYASKGILR